MYDHYCGIPLHRGDWMTSAFEINPTLCFTLLGSFVIYLWTRPSRVAVLATVLITFGLRLLSFRVMGGVGAYYGVRWISWGAFLGIAALIVLLAQFLAAPRPSRQSIRRTFFAAAVFPLCGLLIGYTIPVTTWLRPKTWDAWLLAFDGSLGFQPSFLLGRFLLHRPTAWGLELHALASHGCGVGDLVELLDLAPLG